MIKLYSRNNCGLVPYQSNIVHFRCRSNQVTDSSFDIGTKVVKVASEYVYLGLLLTEHLDDTMMTKHVSKSASRAFGLLLSGAAI